MGYTLLGRTDDGARVFIEIRTETGRGTVQTVDHDTVTDVTRVAITGGMYYDGRHRDWDGCGQITEDAARVVDFTGSAFTAEDAASLVQIWERWHLNDMRGGCAHMELPADPSYDARRHITCPETGYVYGSAWLAELVPADVLAEVARLQAVAASSADAPWWAR